MRVFPVDQIARPAYYDRQPVNVIGSYQALVAPHAVVTRWSYSPAFPFAAFIETVNVLTMRISAAGPLGISQATIAFAPFTGGSANIVNALLSSNTVGQTTAIPLSSLGYMAYGDTVSATTQSSDTGGTVFYVASFKGCEFVY